MPFIVAEATAPITMAASAASFSSGRSRLDCSICREEFTEGNLPRILPCSHVYCTSCLAESAGTPRGMVTCPECHRKQNVVVRKLRVCRTTMKLREVNQRKKREAELQKQSSDGSDSASVKGQAQSAAQTPDAEVQELLATLKATIWEASQSGKILEDAIDETRVKRESLLQTMEAAKQTIEDQMFQVIKAAKERKEQLLQSIEDNFQESLSQLTDIADDFKARQAAQERFCNKVAEIEAAFRRDDPADPEEIERLILETQDPDFNFHGNISIPLREPPLDTDDDKYQSILRDVSSLGDIKIRDVTYEVHPVHPQGQPTLATMVQFYLAKTKATRIIRSKWPFCAAQLPNGDITIGSFQNQITVYDSDLKTRRDFPLPENIIGRVTGMCVTPAGKLVISNPAKRSVCVVQEGGLESSFETRLPPLEKHFDPCGLACNKEGEVFVCDRANHLVRVFDQSGKECRRFGGLGEEPGKLSNPRDVAVTPDGKVAVADTGNHRIQVFDGTTGQSLATFGSRGSGPDQLDGPVGLAIDSLGFVAVAEGNNDRVQLFTPGWESFHILKSQEGPFRYPQGITITKRNEIVVCDCCSQRVQMF